MRRGTVSGVVSTVVVIASVALAFWLGAGQFGESRNSNLPISSAREGEFVVIIRCRGEIQAARAAQIYAPLIPNLRIAWMTPPGELVQQGEPIIRFDSSTAQQELIQKQSALEHTEAALAQAIAETRVAVQRDESELRDARFEVELAELKAANTEFVGRIQAEQSEIDVRVARQKLRTLEAEAAHRVVSNESKVASLTRQKEHAEAEAELTEARLAQMEIPAPLTGYPVYAMNPTQLLQTNPQPFREGDSVSGGVTLAVIPDLSSLYMDVSVEEIDRGRMETGTQAIIRVDALPELVIEAKLTGISPLAEFSLDTFSRSFHVYAALGNNADPRLRPGMNGGMDVVIERIPAAIAIPVQALFTRDGRPAVYVVEHGGYRLVEVEVLARNPDEVAIAGIPGGTRVALADPGGGSDRSTPVETSSGMSFQEGQ